MRNKEEEVIEKVVNKIIDSKVLLTGDGDFCVDSLEDNITHLYFRNLFSPESRIKFIFIDFYRIYRTREDGVYKNEAEDYYALTLRSEDECLASFSPDYYSFGYRDLSKSPSFMRLVEYIEKNKHLILHNDKEYGKSHKLTDADFI